MKIYYTVFLFLSLFSFFSCSKSDFVFEDYSPETATITIKSGDIFFNTLKQTKLSVQEMNDITQTLGRSFNLNKCMPGDFYEITYSSYSPTWTNFKYYPQGQDFYSLKKSSANEISLKKLKLNTEKQIYEATGTLDTSLWETMSKQNISPETILTFADIFAWQIDFLTDPRQGDVFKIIYETETINKKNTVIGIKILAGQYITKSSTHTAILFTNEKGNDGYFDEHGKSIRSAFLKAPLQFRRISSFFTKKRFHPVLKYYRAHEGIDYAAPSGTPVSAIGDGTVTKSQYSGGFGNLIILKHNNGYETYYGHLSKYARGIRRGVKVKQGQVIGYVGSTGLSTGPHLDFRMRQNGRFINFLTMKMPPTLSLSGNDKDMFLKNKDKITERLDNIKLN